MFIKTVFVLVFVVHMGNSSPFIYNPSALPVLISSASASQQPISSNIADLRSKKTEKLQEEKQGPIEEINNDDENDNEVAPSLLQKKVNKILNKLRFFATLSNLGNKNADKNQSDQDFEKEFNEGFQFKNETMEDLEPTTSVESLETKDEPEKVTIDIETDKIKRQTPRGNLSLSPGDVGVFFMELFGSLIGLAYGAFAQISQNTPAVNESV